MCLGRHKRYCGRWGLWFWDDYDNQYIGDLNGSRVAGYSIRCVKSS